MSADIQSFSQLFSRKKVFLPAVPTGIDLAQVLAAGNTPTTTHLQSAGDQKGRIVNINSKHMFGVSTTTATISYDLKYAAYKIVDYDDDYSYTPEAVDEGDTAMNTDLDESVYLAKGDGTDKLTQYAGYRSMRGTINGGSLDQQDFVSFKFELDAAPTEGASIYFVGLEIDYAMRIREPQVENLT